MIRSLYFTPEGKIKTGVEQGDLISLLQEDGGVLWTDMHADDKQNYQQVMESVFGFHPLAISDALEEKNVPKVDDWGKYLYMGLQDIEAMPEDTDMVRLKELDVFVGEGFLVTYHSQPIEALEKVWEICQWDKRFLKRGALYLLYHIVDFLVEDHLPVLDQIELEINEMEDQILHAPKEDTLERIFMLKRGLLRIRRMMIPQREVFYKLVNSEFAVMNDERLFFRNIYDHYVLLNDLTDSLRELLASALEIYLSAVNNRMNKVVQILTVITTMFMPLTFITGFFGMNFFQAEFSIFTTLGKIVFMITLICMVTVPAGMYFWLRRRAWM